jgi:UDP-glucose 4-epimerase
MKLLITGGAGFIGSHLAERCLQEGWKVAIIDDLSTGSMENIAHLKLRQGFSYTIDSVFHASRVQELVDEADLVFHFAAAVGVQLIVESPVHTIETNVHGTEVVLRAAAKKKKPIVIASTSEVYGKSVDIPFREEADLVLGPTTRGRWSYACSKMLDEFLGLAYWNEKGVPVTITRFFNTVGPRQSDRYGMVLPRFVGQALRGEPITVFGSGEQKRCFGYVGDVVEALVRIAKHPSVAGEVINIGNDQEISIEELARTVIQITGSDSEIRKIPYALAYGPGFEDMFRRVPSLEKLQRLTGYRPVTPLAAIIELVASDLARKMEANVSVAPSWVPVPATA